MTDPAEVIARIADERAMWPMADEIKAAVAMLAQEIERLKDVARKAVAELADAVTANEQITAAEIDARRNLLARAESAETRWQQCLQEMDQIDAIEAATIERCAKIAESSAVHHNGLKVGTGIALAIRALAKEPTAATPGPAESGKR